MDENAEIMGEDKDANDTLAFIADILADKYLYKKALKDIVDYVQQNGQMLSGAKIIAIAIAALGE